MRSIKWPIRNFLDSKPVAYEKQNMTMAAKRASPDRNDSADRRHARSKEQPIRVNLPQISDLLKKPQIARGWGFGINPYVADAAHSTPVPDQIMAFWSLRIKPAGVAAGHDYCTEWPDVTSQADASATRWSVEGPT